VKRWDTWFFDFSRDSLNRANMLIASATMSVIAGVILLLLRQEFSVPDKITALS